MFSSVMTSSGILSKYFTEIFKLMRLIKLIKLRSIVWNSHRIENKEENNNGSGKDNMICCNVIYCNVIQYNMAQCQF